ncbi:DUF3293 domain-containing protein [Falsiroseomonas sp. CW058]|uniref:DUF3293 domain-containing protein n=1 Tax=Falsiroseomonas sp. CW058 TaxID=3388664 RepID=UPI003D30F7A3
MRAAYARTDYEAGGIVAHIGARSPALDALLRAGGVRRAAFVTAWNPYSRKMPRGWNDRMLDRLRGAARGRILAEGWGSGHGWAERHLLLAGDPRRIAVLARRFRQHALVAVAVGKPVRIILGLAAPRAATGVDARTRREER